MAEGDWFDGVGDDFAGGGVGKGLGVKFFFGFLAEVVILEGDDYVFIGFFEGVGFANQFTDVEAIESVDGHVGWSFLVEVVFLVDGVDQGCTNGLVKVG